MSASEAFAALIDRLTNWRRYLALYPSAVAAVRDDGTLDVIPDDPSIRGQGLAVIYRSGLAGWTSKPVVGDRVLLGFEGGDIARPYALGWWGGGAGSAAFRAGEAKIARVGDSVDCGTLLVAQTIPPGIVTVKYFPAGPQGAIDLAIEAATHQAAISGGTEAPLQILPMTGGLITSGAEGLTA